MDYTLPSSTITCDAANDNKANGREAKEPIPGLSLAHHLHLTEGSGIDPEVVRERGYETAYDPIDLVQLGLPPSPTPGIVHRVFPPGAKGDERRIFVYRPDDPADPKHKYDWPKGVKKRLDSPPRCHDRLRDTSTTLHLTEGVKKADALASKGAVVISVDGVDCYGGKPEPGLPIFEDWQAITLNNRLARIVYDSDAWTKPQVMRAQDGLSSFLRARGARVEHIRLPSAEDGSKQGIDDYLAAGHTLADLESLVSQPRENPLIDAGADDIGNGLRFAYVNDGWVKYCTDRQAFYVYDNKRWDAASPELVTRQAKATIRETRMAIAALPDSHPKQNELIRFMGGMGSRRSLEAMIQLAKDELIVRLKEFDQHPWLFNCANGTLDLRTEELRPHDPEDLITAISPVVHDPDAECPRWLDYLLRAMGGSAEMVAYLQKLVGICLTGDVSVKFFPILYGPKDTGKTTFVNTIREMLGEDYAYVATAATFTEQSRNQGGSGASPDMVQLCGKRMVIVSETPEGMQLNAARIKAMTGRTAITARDLYKPPFTFNPTFKIVFETNNRPVIRDSSDATADRVHLIPFEVVIPKADQDPGLEDALRAELPGILRWAVEGCGAWLNGGRRLERPTGVEKATKAYVEGMDPLKDFIEERCELREDASVSHPELYRAYKAWAETTGDYPFGKHRFNDKIEARGIERQTKVWKGIRLLPEQAQSKPRASTSTAMKMWGE